jgi:hypothetical protein
MKTATAAKRAATLARHMGLTAILSASLAGWATLTAHAQSLDWTPPPPPPARIEAPPEPPDGAFVWRPGHWTFEGREYLWVPGEYVERPHAGERWVTGYWARGAQGGWIWIPGHWQP